MLPNAKMRDRVHLVRRVCYGEARPCAKLAGAARTLHVSWSARSSQCHFALGCCFNSRQSCTSKSFLARCIRTRRLPSCCRAAVSVCPHALHQPNGALKPCLGLAAGFCKWMRLTKSQVSVPASACRCSPSQQAFRAARPLAHAAHTQHRCVPLVLPAVRLTVIHIC